MKIPLYKQVERLTTLYRRVAIRWPAAKRTQCIYQQLKTAVRRMSR